MIITKRMRRNGRTGLNRRLLVIEMQKDALASQLWQLQRELPKLPRTDIVFLPHGFKAVIK